MSQTTLERKQNLPEIGTTHVISNFLLRCTQVAGEFAVVWEVFDNGELIGEARMGWDCVWRHNLNSQEFSGPQEVIVSLQELSAQREQRSQEVEVVEVHNEDEYVVKSGENYYVVRPYHEDPHQRCECGDAHFRGAFCKHQRAAKRYHRYSATREWETARGIDSFKGIKPTHNSRFASKYGVDVHQMEYDLGLVVTVMEVKQSGDEWAVVVGSRLLHVAKTQREAQKWMEWKHFHGSLAV